MSLVPNKHPTIPSARRIAFIGESPGADEERQGEPFVGASGRFLMSLLSQAGLSRETSFFGNITGLRPPGNDIYQFPWTGPEIQGGLEQLRKDIELFNPHLVVLLGNVPLKAAKEPKTLHHKGKYKNAQWRGSLFLCDDDASPFYGRKCMSTFHPAYVLRDYGTMPLLAFDLRRAAKEGATPELVIPKRDISIIQTADEAIKVLGLLAQSTSSLGCDIEGYVHRLQCIAFSPTPSEAYVLPFLHRDGSSHFPSAEEPRVWHALAFLLENPSVGKIWQNGLYDRFILQYGHGIRVRGNVDDIMLKHWELNSELSKGENNADKRKAGLNLALQTSLYTNEPFYKSEYASTDDLSFWRYNGKDACVTKEIDSYLELALTAPCSKRHYRMNVSLLNPLLYMELKGMLYDIEGANARRAALQRQLFVAQARLNGLTGRGFLWKDHAERDAVVAQKMLVIKGDRPRKKYAEAYHQLHHLLRQPNPTLATMGEIEDLCEVSLNTSSPDQMCAFLYEELKLPVQYNDPKEKDADGNPKPKTPTADYEALLKLAKEVAADADPCLRQVIALCIEIRALATRQEMLAIQADKDGRIRCGYNIVGSNTGRITCYKSPTGSGYNLQTIPNYTRINDAPGGILGDRDLFLADKGYWFFQCDLKGADGWTVAAYCAMLGDSTMLDDYRYGLKPYLILTAMLRGLACDYQDRDSLKAACRTIDKDSWDAFAAKRVQHGAAYLEGEVTIAKNILTDSEGKLHMPTAECGKLKRFYMQRYPGIPRWHDRTATNLRRNPTLVAASGQIRQFFGRREEILTKAVAFEPQANTSYATNLAIHNLWNDPENRGADNELSIQPLHQVHDAVCGQFPKTTVAWALPKIRGYFDNPLVIAGQSITIPFDGAYGPSWGSQKEGVI